VNRLICALLLCLPAVPAMAQDDRPLTDEQAASIAQLYNRPGSIHLTGESRIPAGTALTGDVASSAAPSSWKGRSGGMW